MGGSVQGGTIGADVTITQIIDENDNEVERTRRSLALGRTTYVKHQVD
jgi:hypothetical protein